MNELISVIVPVYNVEKYIERCVKSLIGQSYKNIEVLLIDDGSTDKSGDICNSLVSLDSRLRVYHKKNGGLSSARNYGIQYATGEILAFIDSDDCVYKDFFKILMEKRKLTGANIVSSNMFLFSGESEPNIINDTIPKLKVLHGNEIIQEYFAPKENKPYIYHGLCMKIYDKDLFSGLQFEEGRLHEDLFITYKLLKKTNTFCYVDIPIYFYNQGNANSICKNFRKKNFIDEYDAFEQMKKEFELSNEVKIDFIHFLIFQYLNLIYLGKQLDDRSLLNYISNMKKWVRKNLKFDAHLEFRKKIFIRTMLENMWLYKIVFKK